MGDSLKHEGSILKDSIIKESVLDAAEKQDGNFYVCKNDDEVEMGAG